MRVMATAAKEIDKTPYSRIGCIANDTRHGAANVYCPQQLTLTVPARRIRLRTDSGE
jgi:hypothetical protein